MRGERMPCRCEVAAAVEANTTLTPAQRGRLIERLWGACKTERSRQARAAHNDPKQEDMER